MFVYVILMFSFTGTERIKDFCLFVCEKGFGRFSKRQNVGLVKIESICRRQSEMTNFVCDRVENIVGKGENAGYQHFLL